MATVNIIDLTAAAVPSTSAVTLTTADEAYVVLLPRNCSGVVLQPVTNAAKFSYLATPDVDVGANAHSLAAGVITSWSVDRPVNRRDAPRIYLQTAAGGSVVIVSMRPRTGLYPE